MRKKIDERLHEFQRWKNYHFKSYVTETLGEGTNQPPGHERVNENDATWERHKKNKSHFYMTVFRKQAEKTSDKLYQWKLLSVNVLQAKTWRQLIP